MELWNLFVRDIYNPIWPNIAATLIGVAVLEARNIGRHSKLVAKVEAFASSSNGQQLLNLIKTAVDDYHNQSNPANHPSSGSTVPLGNSSTGVGG